MWVEGKMQYANESFNLISALSPDSLPGEMMDRLSLKVSCIGLLLAAKSILKELSTVILRRAPLVDTRPKASEREKYHRADGRSFARGVFWNPKGKLVPGKCPQPCALKKALLRVCSFL